MKPEKKEFLNRHRFLLISFVIMLTFYSWMAVQIPYTHDDWDWGIQVGLQHLLTADINSRYAGNLIEVVLTRNAFLKSLVMGLVFSLIPLAATAFAVIIKENRKTDRIQTSIFMFTNLLILLIPEDIWRQTNGWVAGFSNFVISALALLSYYLILLNYRSPNVTRKGKVLTGVLVFAFGVIIQLFLENLTVYIFLFSIFFTLLNRKQHDMVKRMIPLLAGNLMGLIIMFSSSVYSTLVQTGYAIGTYRQLMYDPNQPLSVFIAGAIRRYYEEFIPQIVFHNGIFMGIIAGIMTGLVLIKTKRGNLRLYFTAGNILFCLYYAYSYFREFPFSRFLSYFGMETYHFILLTVDCVFVLFVAIETILLFKEEKKILFWLLVLWLSPFAMMAPMIMINTVGPRCFYTTDICFITFASLALYLLITQISRHINVLTLLFAFALLISGIHWIRIYEPIGEQRMEREKLIQAAITEGSEQIVFSEYPNDEYLWVPDPAQEKPWRGEYFKEFYHIPENVEIWFESWGNPA